MSFTKQDRYEITRTATKLRKNLCKKYNNNLMGKCIEATDTLVKDYNIFEGFKAEAKQVWCLYEKFETCSNYCFEEHWIVKITKGSKVIYIDITMDQFQWAFTRELPAIYIGETLPNFYLPRKPGKVTLDKCGWNNWYNYGNYVNKFDYYGGQN